MNLPKVITELVKAQDNFDSVGYANCFSENAVVYDEGKTYQGKTAIEKWIDKANRDYKTTMKPIEYAENEQVLKAEISGTFDGSPIVLAYRFEFNKGLIERLEIV